jgi:hypothetical protein
MPSRNIPNRADAAKEAPRCRAYRSSGTQPRTKPSEGASSCEGPSLPSAIPDADSEHTASVPVQPIRVHSGCRTVDTQNRPANGRQPGTSGTQLQWRTVTGTRAGSSEMLGVPRPYTTPCGLLKQPDKQKVFSTGIWWIGLRINLCGSNCQTFLHNGRTDSYSLEVIWLC